MNFAVFIYFCDLRWACEYLSFVICGLRYLPLPRSRDRVRALFTGFVCFVCFVCVMVRSCVFWLTKTFLAEVNFVFGCDCSAIFASEVAYKCKTRSRLTRRSVGIWAMGVVGRLFGAVWGTWGVWDLAVCDDLRLAWGYLYLSLEICDLRWAWGDIYIILFANCDLRRKITKYN